MRSGSLDSLGFPSSRGLLPALVCLPLLSAPVRVASAQQDPRGVVSSSKVSSTAMPTASVAASSPNGDSPELPDYLAPVAPIAAVVPGLLAHGLGASLQGRPELSQRLYWAQAAAFGLFLAGAATVVASGASQYVVGPGALATAFGVTGFSSSWLAGVYSTLAPADGLGRAVGSLPLVEAQTGYMQVYDAQFSHRHFLVNSVHTYLQGWHLGVGADFAPGQSNERWSAVVGRRVWGVDDSSVHEDGSYLELRLAHSEHRFTQDGFDAGSTDLAAEGRLDLRRYLPGVQGAFVQSEAGYGRYRVDFDGLGSDATSNTSLLLMHMGFGLYLGNRSSDALGGEVEVYYDHRHDGMVSGLKVRGLGSGALGHFGARARFRASPTWGLATVVEAGAAWSWTTSLVLRSNSILSEGAP